MKRKAIIDSITKGVYEAKLELEKDKTKDKIRLLEELYYGGFNLKDTMAIIKKKIEKLKGG